MLGGVITTNPARVLAFVSLALSVAAIALLPDRAAAASGWQIVLDRPTPNFGTVDFVSDSEGWMPAGGGLLHTTDGGATWTENAKLTVNDVDFFDREHGWAVGPNGAIYGTSDRGQRWSRQASGLSGVMYFTDVEAISSSEAWAVALEGTSDTPHFPASAVLHTTDGGQSWQQTELPLGGAFDQVEFFGGNGWLLGSICRPTCQLGETPRAILRTEDGGSSWSPVEDSLNANPTRINFVDAQHGWLIGGLGTKAGSVPTVFRTDDGGATWTHFPTVAPSEFTGFVDLAFEDSSRGWLLVAHGGLSSTLSVEMTTDGGASWTALWAVKIESTQYGAHLSHAAGKLFLTGDRIALRSIEAGATWQEMRHPALTLDEIDFVDGDTGFALDGDEIVRTNDGGRGWEHLGTNFQPFITEGRSAAKFGFFKKTTGVVVSENCRPMCHPEISRTTDGGATWSVVASFPSDVLPVMKADIGEGGAAIIVGANGLIVTSDYGATWQFRDVPPQDGYLMLDSGVADTTHLWASSYPAEDGPSALHLSSDAGETWREIYRGIPLGDIEFFDSAHGWARGVSPDYLRTSDGGRTWETIPVPQTSVVYEIAFADPMNGWVSATADCGDGDCRFGLLHTSDSGATWSEQRFEAPDDAVAHDLEFVDARTGWFTTSPGQVFGLGGNPPDRTILYHTTDGGGGPIGEPPTELPDVGAGPNAAQSSPLLPLLLAATGLIALAASLALRRRQT